MEAGRKGYGKVVDGIYIIDACAMIAYLNHEQGSDVVKNLLRKTAEDECITYMHMVNFLETYYDHIKNPDAPKMDFYRIIEALPIGLINDLSKPLFDKIVFLKTNFRISLADAFLLATAIINNATVVTSDHHEFDAVERSGMIKFHWIR